MLRLPGAVVLEEEPAAADAAKNTEAPSDAPAPPAEAEGVMLAEEPTKSAAQRRKEALDAFDIGEVDVALEAMQALLRECLALSEEECKPGTRAVLFRDVGIILADGKAEHGAAVRVFRQAVRANRNISIPDAYRSIRVDGAFNEAVKEETGFVAAGSVSAVPPAATDGAATAEVTEGRERGVFVHVVAPLRAGTMMAGSAGSAEIGQVGVEGLVAYAAASGFIIGGMTHVSYKWSFDNPAYSWGTWGESVALGGVLGRSGSDTAHYLLGGVGFHYWPDAMTAGLALHMRYDASLSGLGLGVGIDLVHTPIRINAGSLGGSVTEVLFGLHLGFADVL